MKSAQFEKEELSDHKSKFHPGEHVAYPAHGVGQIEMIEQRKLIDMAKGLLVNEICIVKEENEQKISEEIESLFPG